jgi:UDP-glucose 4-epimerase
MKKVLITGSNSYVGTNVEKWLLKEPKKFHVETISVRGDLWKSFDFSKFDVVFHVAGIAHAKIKKKNIGIYRKINTILPYEIAKIAKSPGVTHFIFMSSMSVFSNKNGKIDINVEPLPSSKYGESKLNAEKLLSKLSSNNFGISIIRPPMIYGPNCKGNYNSLRYIIKKFFIFPKLYNLKSLLFIDNFSSFLQNIISDHLTGIFHPHNEQNVSTSYLIELIALNQKKVVLFSNLLGFLLRILPSKTLSKLTRSTYYDYSADKLSFIDFKTSVKITEDKWIEKKN